MRPVRAVGLMTGTILDGYVDIALLKTDGQDIHAFGPWEMARYPNDITALLKRTYEAALEWRFVGPEPAVFAEAEAALTQGQAEVVLSFLERNGLVPDDIDVVGLHGQTVLHKAPTASERGYTRQLGDGPALAHTTGIDVVYDFRAADMAAGGHGAPISPIYHKALLKKVRGGSDTAFLNLGGVANLTVVHEGEVIGFDTGPANGPVNDWFERHGRGEMDENGRAAAHGEVDEDLLRELLDHPFLTAPYPKSLDRFDFSADMADGQNFEDGAALLTAFTAGTIGRALDLLPVRPSRIVVYGGGRRNPTMMRELRKRTGATIVPAEDVGLRGDAIEAECFAYLAVRSKDGLPFSFPHTTGVSHPMTGGVFAKANRAL